MSGTVHTPNDTTPQDVPDSHPTSRHPVARLCAPVALVLGAFLAATGMALHLPAMADDANVAAIADASARWLTSHLLLGFGFALVAAGAWSALTQLRRDRGATLTAMGIVTTSLGAITMALGDIAHGAVSFILSTELEPARSLELHEVFFEHPVTLGLNTGPLLISVGMLVLGAGMLRSSAHPRWVGLVIMLTPIAVNAGFSLGLPTLVHGVPFFVGMSTFAYATVRALQVDARTRTA